MDCCHPIGAQFGESKADHRLQSFGSIALVPPFLPDAVAHLDLIDVIIDLHNADGADGFPDAAGNNGPLVLPGIIVTVNPVRKDLFTDCQALMRRPGEKPGDLRVRSPVPVHGSGVASGKAAQDQPGSFQGYRSGMAHGGGLLVQFCILVILAQSRKKENPRRRKGRVRDIGIQ